MNHYAIILSGLGGYLVMALIMACICRAIMKSCGGNTGLGFAMGFLGVFGLIVTVCIASTMKSASIQNQNGQFRANPSPYQPWKCLCGTDNRYDRQFCANCGRPKAETVQYTAQKTGIQPPPEPQRQIPETWKCMCGGMNEIHSNICQVCGKPKIETFRFMAAKVSSQNRQQPTSYSAPAPQPSSVDGQSKAEHINSLKSLREAGLISEEEFRDKIRELR